MKAPVLSVVQEYAKIHSNRAYLYSFDYEGKFSSFKNDFNSSHYPFFNGVHHSDENIYLFPYPNYATELNAKDRKIAKTMIELWTSFAMAGVPASPNTPDWPTVSGINIDFFLCEQTLIK